MQYCSSWSLSAPRNVSCRNEQSRKIKEITTFSSKGIAEPDVAQSAKPSQTRADPSILIKK
ncbi:hypothetical protein I7I50_11529 [Histoplasma capsulatum G186AR]|uniref:Uncharacterized protein n=1 Tax=Ajellomyces capsulatus TaxID=5037 RepID=A0A8H7Z5D1_AJECA|nr:hypothetical protein I7I52_02766 [Histoplasma capsulatum]QSS70032.1 hypothetical protein I7I50_11529 [Histoplasma capsulatum G186AR]